jgi:hypothetical protein
VYGSRRRDTLGLEPPQDRDLAQNVEVVLPAYAGRGHLQDQALDHLAADADVEAERHRRMAAERADVTGRGSRSVSGTTPGVEARSHVCYVVIIHFVARLSALTAETSIE